MMFTLTPVDSNHNIPGYMDPNSTLKNTINQLLSQFRADWKKILFLTGGPKSIETYGPSGRLDFQGFTANRDFNYQIQVGSQSYGAVILPRRPVEIALACKNEDDRNAYGLYIARQLGAALLQSTRVGHIFNLHFVEKPQINVQSIHINTLEVGYALQCHSNTRDIKLNSISTVLHEVVAVIDTILNTASLILKHMDINKGFTFGKLQLKVLHETITDASILHITLIYDNQTLGTVNINLDNKFHIPFDNKDNLTTLYAALIDSARQGNKVIELSSSDKMLSEQQTNLHGISFTRALEYEIKKNRFKGRFIDSIHDVAFFGGIHNVHNGLLKDNPFITNAAAYVLQNITRTFDITELDYSDLTSSLKLRKILSIPTPEEGNYTIPQVDIYQDTSFILDASISLTTNLSNIQSEVAYKAEVGFEFASIAASASASYSSASKVINKTSDTMAFTTVACKVGYARLKDFLDLSTLIDPEFASAVKLLGNGINYHDFIKSYGTHYIYQFDLGGSGKSMFSISESDLDSVTSSSLDVSIAVKAYVASASASRNASSSTEVQKFNKDQKLSLRFFGGKTLPTTNEQGMLDYSGWISSLFEAPMPTKISARPIASLLTQANFPEIADIDSRRATLMQEIHNVYPDLPGQAVLQNQFYMMNIYLGDNTIIALDCNNVSEYAYDDAFGDNRIKYVGLADNPKPVVCVPAKDMPDPNGDYTTLKKALQNYMDQFRDQGSTQFTLNNDDKYYMLSLRPNKGPDRDYYWNPVFNYYHGNVEQHWIEYLGSYDFLSKPLTLIFRFENLFGDLGNNQLYTGDKVKIYTHCPGRPTLHNKPLALTSGYDVLGIPPFSDSYLLYWKLQNTLNE